MKQASVPAMEAYFNFEYDSLLISAEDEVSKAAEETYLAILSLFRSEGVSDITRAAAEAMLSELYLSTYSSVEEKFVYWYSNGFGQLSSRTDSEISSLYGSPVDSFSEERASSRVSGIISTVISRVNSDTSEAEIQSIAKSSGRRFAITEVNSAAGALISRIATSMFNESVLYKRWITRGDERVRFTHRAVASRKPIPHSNLYQVGDVFMRFPADPQAFGGNVAGEVINCRCRSLILPYSNSLVNSLSLNRFLSGSL